MGISGRLPFIPSLITARHRSYPATHRIPLSPPAPVRVCVCVCACVITGCCDCEGLCRSGGTRHESFPQRCCRRPPSAAQLWLSSASPVPFALLSLCLRNRPLSMLRSSRMLILSLAIFTQELLTGFWMPCQLFPFRFLGLTFAANFV